MLHHPGLWVFDIDNAGTFGGLPYIRETGQLMAWKIDSSSAAASTGITSGDTIIGINGVKLRDKLEAYFGAFVSIKPGQQIDMELLKNGEPLHKKLTIERNYGIDRPKGYLGITSYWSGFDSSLSKTLPEQGVFVGTVVPDAPAEKAGIKPGDVILRFNTVRLFASYQYTTLIENSTPGQTIPIQLLRGVILPRFSGQ
jgi:S1-C subfamily serine protease